MVRLYSDANILKFKQQVGNNDWKDVYESVDTNIAYSPVGYFILSHPVDFVFSKCFVSSEHSLNVYVFIIFLFSPLQT